MTAIPRDRLDSYAATVATFGEVGAAVATIRRLRADGEVLESEGRGKGKAAKGAKNLLDACVRRLCATRAASHEDAHAKLDMLVSLKQVYHGGNGSAHVLMGATIDAAIACESESWPLPTTRH